MTKQKESTQKLEYIKRFQSNSQIQDLEIKINI